MAGVDRLQACAPHPVARPAIEGRRLLTLTLLYAVAIVASVRPVVDPDVWWHLRTGQWILEHGSVPTTDPFSSYGAGKPWVAYSWLFEVLLFLLHRAFGLPGLVVYTVLLSLGIAAALHALVRRSALSFPWEIALTALAVTGLLPLFSPRPWLLSILFFAVELNIVQGARASGDARRLLLLPPLFMVWANVHIQFVYGLFALCLAAAEAPLARLLTRVTSVAHCEPRWQLTLWLVTTASVFATLATPYRLDLYRALIEIIAQSGQFQYIRELTALAFRSPSDWCVLTLTMSAALTLGWQRQFKPFPFLLLATSAFLSFRAMRDAWVAVVAGVAIIANASQPGRMANRFVFTKCRRLAVAGGVAITIILTVGIRDISEPHLQAVLAAGYPVGAAAAVERFGYPGPVFNDFNWGGYLIWRLPDLPVTIDGRGNLHGDARVMRSLATWAGKRGWASDPDLAAARVVIANAHTALASLLIQDSRFELVYQDPVALVFVARPPPREG